jgi:hypothetical protein
MPFLSVCTDNLPHIGGIDVPLYFDHPFAQCLQPSRLYAFVLKIHTDATNLLPSHFRLTLWSAIRQLMPPAQVQPPLQAPMLHSYRIWL